MPSPRALLLLAPALYALPWHRCVPTAVQCVSVCGAAAGTAGLEAARALCLPISEHATLFSTPPDLEELEALLAGHPFPEQRCFIRRGHGFFILGEDVKHAQGTFEEFVVPYLMKVRQKGQQQA